MKTSHVSVIKLSSHHNIAMVRNKLSSNGFFHANDDESSDKPFLNSVGYLNDGNSDTFTQVFLNSNGMEIHLVSGEKNKDADEQIDFVKKLRW